MYTYYKEVKSQSHYLFASELTLLFYACTGLLSMQGKFPKNMMIAWLNDKEQKDSRVDAPLYYKTSYGLSRVYQYGEEYLESLINQLSSMEAEPVVKIKIGEKTYSLRKGR